MPFKNAVLIRASNCCLYKNTYVKRMYFIVDTWASLWENRSSGFPTRSDTNRSVQPQKMARGLKFRIYVVQGSYYTYSENKGADQLRSYCATDMRLCFRICKKPVFSQQGSHENSIYQMGSISRHDMYLHTLPMTQTDVSLRSWHT